MKSILNFRHAGLLLTIGILTAMIGCRPSEKHYRSVYETTLAIRDSIRAIDETIYGKYRNRIGQTSMTVGTDTLWFATEPIGYTEGLGGSDSTVYRYNIVVGQFKQIFNAKEMRNRLLTNGYPEAMVFQNREPMYYVVALTVRSPKEAIEALHTVEADTSLHIRAPLPYVLRPAHLAR